MALKSVFQVEIDDTRFKSFKQQFDRYQEEVKKLPAEWRELNSEISETKTLMEKMAEAAQLNASSSQKQLEHHKEASAVARNVAIAWSFISRQVGNVKDHIDHMTSSLVKWSTVTAAFAGLLGAGSLFGLDRLANSIAQQRRLAMGMGMSIGQRSAFDTNYSRALANPNSLLSGAATAKYDYTSEAYNSFLNAGVSQSFIKGHNPAEIGREFLRDLDVKFADLANKPGKEGEIGARANAMGVTAAGISVQDLVAYLSLSGKEKEEMGKRMTGDVPGMNVSDEVAKKWTDLVTQLDRVGKTIESVFMTRIVALAPAVEKLSKSLEQATDTFVKSETFKAWMDGLGAEIEKFAKWLETPEVEETEKGFLDWLKKAGDGLKSFVVWVAKYAPAISGQSPEATRADVTDSNSDTDVNSVGGGRPRFPHSTGPGTHEFQGPAGVVHFDAPANASVREKALHLVDKLMDDYGLTHEKASAMVGWFLYESGGKLDPAARGPGGDLGWTQAVGERKARLLALGPPTDETNYQHINEELRGKWSHALRHLKEQTTLSGSVRVVGRDYEGAGGTPLGLEEEIRRHTPWAEAVDEAWLKLHPTGKHESAGALPALRVRGRTGSHPNISVHGAANNTAPVGAAR